MTSLRLGAALLLVACSADPPPPPVSVPLPIAPMPVEPPPPPPPPAPDPAPEPVASAKPWEVPQVEKEAPEAPGPRKNATLRRGEVHVTGRLPVEVISRIVRQNFGRFRLCYENSLRTDKKREGKVVTRFVIDRSGAVAKADDDGSDIGDPKMIACVVNGFANMSFPQPEGGVVNVVYPIIFQPPMP